MVTGTVPVQPQNEETVLALACSLYEQGARAESFRLLLRLSAVGVKTAPLYYCVLNRQGSLIKPLTVWKRRFPV